MTTREQEAIEIAAKAAFDAFYAEGTPYTDIERAMFKQVAGAVYDALLAAGVIPAEGTVVVDARRWERVRRLAIAGTRFEALASTVELGDLDAIPDAPTGEGE